MKPTLIIADDHPIVRKGLSETLEQSGKWQILAEAENGKDALALFQQYRPDVMLLDISMGEFGGLEVAECLLTDYPHVRLVIMTMYTNPVFYQKAKAIGVQGYLLKDDSTDTILEGLAAVLAGKQYVSSSLEVAATPDEPPFIDPTKVLTETELTIFYAIAELKNNRQIAEALGITVKTVQNHRYNMGEKLELKGKQALLSFAGNWRKN